jgi:two-component system, OmpR family, copper resistance phosphate regulon response regulator CusR
MADILIVEDEPKVAAFIQKGLEEYGFNTQIAYDGLIGKIMALSNNFHLIILDLNIPQINGFQLCKIIRENNTKVPILMLTAMGGIDEKTQGFEAGADDYLLKPFEVKELILRIKALLKRTSDIPSDSKIITIADLEIHLNEKKVFRGSKNIYLRAKEYKLLEFLALNKNKVLDRLEISENVWGINFDTGTNVVDVYINFLRKKIDSDFEPKLIHTRIGLGYVLTELPD